MTRNTLLTIALAVIVISLSLASSDSTARAQRQRRLAADTGVITLGANQILRITVVNRSRADSNIRFRKTEYTEGACSSDGVCKHVVASVNTSAPLTLAPGEAASVDIPNSTSAVGVKVLDAGGSGTFEQVVAQIIDATTGKIVAIINNDDDPLDDNGHGSH